MLGVKRTWGSDERGDYIVHNMPDYIKGGVQAFMGQLTQHGWSNTKLPEQPFPDEASNLTLWDPENLVTDAEAKKYHALGYMNLVGYLIWAARCCFPEALCGCSILGRVMSRPTKLAWRAAIHLLAWLWSQCDRGIKFSSGGNAEPVASVDASGQTDPKDMRVQHGYGVLLAGGPVIAHSSKHAKIQAGMPGREYMALHSCGGHVIWLRELLREMGLGYMVAKPTVIECDSKGAVDWAVFGKIIAGNRSLKVAIHQAVQEWQNDEKELFYLLVPGMYNRYDLCTKANSKNDIRRLLMWATGYADGPSLDPAVSDMAKYLVYTAAWENYLNKLG